MTTHITLITHILILDLLAILIPRLSSSLAGLILDLLAIGDQYLFALIT